MHRAEGQLAEKEQVPGRASLLENTPLEQVPGRASLLENTPLEQVPGRASLLENHPLEQVPGRASLLENTTSPKLWTQYFPAASSVSRAARSAFVDFINSWRALLTLWHGQLLGLPILEFAGIAGTLGGAATIGVLAAEMGETENISSDRAWMIVPKSGGVPTRLGLRVGFFGGDGQGVFTV